MQPADEPGQAVLSARLEIDPFEGVLNFQDYFGTRVVGVRHPPPAPASRRDGDHHRRDVPVQRHRAGARPRRRPSGVERQRLAGRPGARGRPDELDGAGRVRLLRPLGGVPHPDAADRTRRGTHAASPAEIKDSAPTPADGRARPCASGCTKCSPTRPARPAYTPPPSRPTAARRGVCQDISHLAIGTAAADGHPDPVRLRIPAPGGSTSRSAALLWASRTPGSSGTTAHGTGIDPTNLTAPGQAHVVVGRGRDYRDVPPVKGVYAGPDASGNDVTVRITRLR